jgi:hypothetical protein
VSSINDWKKNYALLMLPYSIKVNSSQGQTARPMSHQKLWCPKKIWTIKENLNYKRPQMSHGWSLPISKVSIAPWSGCQIFWHRKRTLVTKTKQMKCLTDIENPNRILLYNLQEFLQSRLQTASKKKKITVVIPSLPIHTTIGLNVVWYV